MLSPLQIYSARKALRKGDAARDSRSWPDAVLAYQRYVRLKPQAAHIWVQLGHALKESGSPAKAEAAYREALARRPKDSDIHLQLGHVLKIAGRRDEAIASYRTALALDPLNNNALEELIALGEADDPSQITGSSTCDALRSAGDSARDAKNWAAAVAAYQSYVESVPDDAGMWVQLGHVLRESGRFEEAELAYGTAIEKAPDLADAWFHHALVLKLMGRFEQAEAALRKVAELEPPAGPAAGNPNPQVPSAANDEPDSAVSAGKGHAQNDENWRLIESQSRALRALATELVRLRSELGSVTSRMTLLESQAADRERQVGAQMQELWAQLAEAGESSHSLPLNPLFNHLRERVR